jgi:hypothetical protein
VLFKLDKSILFFCKNHSLRLDEFVNEACRVYLAIYPEAQKIIQAKNDNREMNFLRLGKIVYEKIS